MSKTTLTSEKEVCSPNCINVVIFLRFRTERVQQHLCIKLVRTRNRFYKPVTGVEPAYLCVLLSDLILIVVTF